MPFSSLKSFLGVSYFREKWPKIDEIEENYLKLPKISYKLVSYKNKPAQLRKFCHATNPCLFVFEKKNEKKNEKKIFFEKKIKFLNDPTSFLNDPDLFGQYS